MTKKIRIIVKGSYGESNFGDDLLMCVLENFFIEKFPEVDILFAGVKNTYVENLLVNAGFIDDLEGVVADMLVYGGGTQFFAFKKQQSRIVELVEATLNLLIQDRAKLFNLIVKKLNLEKKNNIRFQSSIGIGIGPFNENPRLENISKLFLQKSEYLAVRDEVSLQYCKNWGLDKAILGADICFSDYLKMDKDFICKKNEVSSKKKIGIIVRDWKHEEQGRVYYDSLLKFADDAAVNPDIEIQFIIFAPGKDLEWIAILKDKDVLTWDPNSTSVFDFLSQMNSFDSFISSRYHGTIFAVMLGKPVVCIEIEPKLEILTKQIKELYLWEQPFDSNKLNDLLFAMDYSVNYNKSLAKLTDLSNSMFLNFETCLNKILCEKY
jgi:polysaccharide pyruvyl transferase WcaK-like protein